MERKRDGGIEGKREGARGRKGERENIFTLYTPDYQSLLSSSKSLRMGLRRRSCG